jgi:flagellar biogenesis protein FliO
LLPGHRPSPGAGVRLLLLVAWVVLIPATTARGVQDESTVKSAASINQPIALDSPPRDASLINEEPGTVAVDSVSHVRDEAESAQAERSDVDVGATLVRRVGDTGPREVFRTDDQRPWYRNSLFSLGVVLSLVGITLWGLRRWLPSLRQPPTSEAIRVVARAALTPRHQLALVQCGHRTILIGVSPDRLLALGEFGSPAIGEHGTPGLDVEAVLRSSSSSRRFDQLLETERNSYAQVLDNRSDLPRIDEHDRRPSPSNSGRSPLRDLLERVRSLKW